MILHRLFHAVSRFPRYISCCSAKNRFPLGQCSICVMIAGNAFFIQHLTFSSATEKGCPPPGKVYCLLYSYCTVICVCLEAFTSKTGNSGDHSIVMYCNQSVFRLTSNHNEKRNMFCPRLSRQAAEALLPTTNQNIIKGEPTLLQTFRQIFRCMWTYEAN